MTGPIFTTAPTQVYLDTLLLYYEEEIEGEAYFQTLADMVGNPDHHNKLQLLAKVEHHAANVTLPLIRKYALTPRSDATLFQSGQDQARACAQYLCAIALAHWPADSLKANRSFITGLRCRGGTSTCPASQL